MTTQIKICGLSTPETVDAAVDAGASHIGLVHYEPSARHVSLEDAARLRRRAPGHVKVVLLTVNMQPAELETAYRAVQPDVLQFHGREAVEWMKMVRDLLKVETWRAVGLREREALDKSAKYVGQIDRLLFDAPAKALPGGNGEAFRWDILDGYDHPMNWALAGGLTPENVGDAIARTGAPLVDTSSGVESAPGVKDVGLIRAFCEAVRSA
ncbi:phosphoribosylanthranilate isomerase [Alteriqipengyuania lutimaris]|uniref:N-(5'-phosphoribosyl)anthranilate isomerase n=1 Tax=Alteriqipengyuania lutimaris TaxID=1538146 RepID=A0A395LMF9_9SPHN|nr:phosphoribosylanthranilate isomerase [Alteriqipengyuania lutimaris]MBB3035206.1 phosphoribosylanthranilate isomerase [Alteriqipengyuania lutimaris]RDS75810.1 phosphoribosylanthranilate isomerase [Alteriqipengyuania lutimaris]